MRPSGSLWFPWSEPRWINVQDDVVGVLDEVLGFEQIRELGERVTARTDYQVSHDSLLGVNVKL